MAHPYTQEGRLETVVALIQLLGLGENPTGDGEKSLKENLKLDGKPKVWQIAQEHPEFFYVTGSGGESGDANRSTYLIARYFSADRKVRLEADFVKSLIDTARELHDRQVSRSQDGRFWVAIIFAAAGGIATIINVLWDAFTG